MNEFDANTNKPSHWLNCLGLERLGVPKRRIVFSPELDCAISEICDKGGLGDLEHLLGFNADDEEPPNVSGREAEIVALRNYWREKQRVMAKNVRKLFGLRGSQ